MLGKTLGHYRIRQEIGAGGMGVVYRAHDEHLNRDVALKVLPRSLGDDAGAQERLRKEALALSKLNHPNIAQVYDFDAQDGVPFLIMEFIPGETLAQKLAGGPIAEEMAIQIGMQTASALEDAAEVGVVHRDIKPSNIILTPKGAVKVLDFGLAKFFPGGEHDMTRSYAELPDAAGTLAYMAPERLKNDPADFRSDIYSLGTVLYEAVTGKRPFAGVDSVTLIAEILSRKPTPPRGINAAVSAGFENVVMRCLAKEPAGRYQRASELRAALETLQESHGEAPLAAAAGNYRARRATSLALITMLAAATGFAIWRAPKNPPTVDASPPSELAVLPLSNAGNDNQTAAFGNGLVETLTTRLTQLSQNHSLQVVPASEIRARGVENLQEANKQFGATLGLELNVERAGESIRVNYSLVDAKRHQTVRGDTITAPASDPFALEDRVADSVVNALQIELTPGEEAMLTQHGTAKPGAYDFYLQGRGYLQDPPNEQNVESAIAEFNQALGEDPEYALAYAGLGEAYWREYKLSTNADWVEKAKSSCLRAITLHSGESEGHICLGLVLTGTGAYEEAVVQYKQAVNLQPTEDGAYRGLALAYRRLNNLPAAEETFRKAIALRPGYWATYNQLGELFLSEGKYKEAEGMFSQVVALAPDTFVGYGNLGATYYLEGEYTKALPMFERSVEIEATAENTSNLASLYFSLRRFGNSARIYEKAVELNRNDYVIWGNLGDAYYWAPGERAKAASAYHTAIDLAKKQLKVNPRDATALGYLAGYQGMLGQTGPAQENIRQALALSPKNSDLLLAAAVIFDEANQKQQALDYLEKSVAAGTPPETLLDNPNLDNLNGQPRFQKLVAPVSPK